MEAGPDILCPTSINGLTYMYLTLITSSRWKFGVGGKGDNLGPE